MANIDALTARSGDYMAALTEDKNGDAVFIADGKVLSVQYGDDGATPTAYRVQDLDTDREWLITAEEVVLVAADPDAAREVGRKLLLEVQPAMPRSWRRSVRSVVSDYRRAKAAQRDV